MREECRRRISQRRSGELRMKCPLGDKKLLYWRTLLAKVPVSRTHKVDSSADTVDKTADGPNIVPSDEVSNTTDPL